MRDPFNGLFRLPSKEERIAARAGAPLNPIKLAMMLSPLQGAMFFSGWLAWTLDAFDFFGVSLSVSRLTEYYDREAKTVTTAITLTLLFRPLGAAIFGLISDSMGRRWPMVANLIILAVLTLSTSFCETFGAFLAVRCLFGIAMGGIWGLATSNALENMPAAPRGLFSGILQQGYAVGYLLASAVNLTAVAHYDDWRVLFWIGAGLSVFGAIVRAVLPESAVFIRVKEERKRSGETSNKGRVFWKQTKEMLKKSWGRIIFAILLMTGFNFLSHSSQDLYPTMIEKTSLAYLPTAEARHLASVATIIGNCGAIAGGFVAGYLSQYLGRRLTIIIFVVFTGCMIPPWILPTTFSGLAAGAFFVQFGVQGAWGVVPAYLLEISPPAYRATMPGVSYQIGNMVSSASSQIEATGGENIQIPNPRAGQPNEAPTIPDYAKVSAILLGVVCGYIILVVIFGKEYRGSSFENAPTATQAHAGEIDPKDLNNSENRHSRDDSSAEHVDARSASPDEKGSAGSPDEKAVGDLEKQR